MPDTGRRYGLDDPGVARALDSLEGKIDAVAGEIRHLTDEVHLLARTKLSVEEFEAYKELQQTVEEEGLAVRRSNVRWAVTTIITILMLTVAAVSLIVTSRPDVIVEPPGPNSQAAVVRVL